MSKLKGEDMIKVKESKHYKRKHIIFSMAVTVVILGLIALLISPFFERFYQGDRITLTIDGKVDGVSTLLDSTCVVCSNLSDERQEVHCNEPGVFSIKGDQNNQEMYTFSFSTKQQRIQLQLIHRNWWQVENCKLVYEIDSTTNKMTYTYIDSEGNTETDTIDYINEMYTIVHETRPMSLWDVLV